MSSDRKGPTGKDALEEMEARLGGLFGNLGKALKDVIDIAQSAEAKGSSGADRTFDFSHGPMRAQSSFRVRVGGVGDSTAADDRDLSQPVNSTTPSGRTDTDSPTTREPLMDIHLDEREWILTAEVPGIPENAVQIEVRGQVLDISATGALTYRTSVSIPDGLDPDSLTHTVTNGILELRGRVSKQDPSA